MKDTEPESSFQSPEDYAEYGEESTEAMMVYQRVRRPLMFHVLVLILLMGAFAIQGLLIAIPVLGIASLFRRLDDGFQIEDQTQPTFTLSVGWVKPKTGVTETYTPYLESLKREWFWSTWMFYLIIIFTPIYIVFTVYKRGFLMLLDIFFLRCWDKWYYAINAEALEEKSKKRFLRGSRILELGRAAGAAPVEFVKNKLGKRELEKDLVAKRRAEAERGKPTLENRGDDDQTNS